MAHEFTEGMFTVIDRKDTAGFAEFFTEDAEFVFGNAAPLCGRAAISAGLGPFFDSIAGLGHEITREWVVDGTHIVEALVTYRRLDGTTVTVPAVSIFRRGRQLIDDYRIYVDLAPLVA